MAVQEVIDFPFGAQLYTRLWFPALLPPEPVAESPPSDDRLKDLPQASFVLVCSSSRNA
jgi:hypothetical protein